MRRVELSQMINYNHHEWWDFVTWQIPTWMISLLRLIWWVTHSILGLVNHLTQFNSSHWWWLSFDSVQLEFKGDIITCYWANRKHLVWWNTTDHNKWKKWEWKYVNYQRSKSLGAVSARPPRNHQLDLSIYTDCYKSTPKATPKKENTQLYKMPEVIWLTRISEEVYGDPQQGKDI